ncbi:CLAVATA3/ESR (CLE)-related protein TDIF [Spatholobus suberectus]|nr:CLAVATA3/ESR (CLE)-related protein TDIF [Spatholobus suberectus]
MAGDTASSFSTCMVLFFSLLLVSHFTVAMLEHSFSPLTSNKEGPKKRNTNVAASGREDSAQNSKKDMALGETGKGSIHVPKREHSQSPNRVFNASAHEVPSGPNPISNSEVFVHIVVLKLKA